MYDSDTCTCIIISFRHVNKLTYLLYYRHIEFLIFRFFFLMQDCTF